MDWSFSGCYSRRKFPQTGQEIRVISYPRTNSVCYKSSGIIIIRLDEKGRTEADMGEVNQHLSIIFTLNITLPSSPSDHVSKSP